MKRFQEKSNIKFNIIFCDNNSTYKPLITFLKEKEKEGYLVYWNKTRHLYPELEKCIKKWYKTNDSPYYITADPDIEMDENCPLDILDLYISLMEKYSNKNGVAPMLRLNDIPLHYPLRDIVLRNQNNIFRKSRELNEEWNGKIIKILDNVVDATWGFYKKDYIKNGLTKNVLRTKSPYIVRHLDWYINPKELTDDQKYYILTNKTRYGHWSTKHLRKKIDINKLKEEFNTENYFDGSIK